MSIEIRKNKVRVKNVIKNTSIVRRGDITHDYLYMIVNDFNDNKYKLLNIAGGNIIGAEGNSIRELVNKYKLKLVTNDISILLNIEEDVSIEEE